MVLSLRTAHRVLATRWYSLFIRRKKALVKEKEKINENS
jgi:hypothetical protein